MKKILLFIVFISSLFTLQAQERNDRIQIKQPIKENVNTEKQKKFKSSALQTLMPSQIIGGTPYSDPSKNFAPQSNLRAAGDVNKDGFQDFYYSVLAANEGTEELSDQVLKTKLFYGSASGISDENSTFFVDSSSIFKDGLVLIDDLTGDDIAEGFIFRDGTLILYSDVSGGTLTQIESMEILTDLSEFLVIKSFGDFNNDSFNDIIVFNNQIVDTQSNEYHVIYGGAKLSEFTVQTIINDEVSDLNRIYQQVLYTDLEDDGTMEIIQIAGLESQNVAKIYVYQLGENDALSAIDTVDFPQTFDNAFNFRSGNYLAVDINNDGFKELVTYVFDRTYVFAYDTTSSINTFDVSNPDEFSGNGFSVIGDYDNDGFNDLLITGDTYNIVSGNSDLNLNLSVADLGEEAFSLITSLANGSGYSGDVNGDGFDDLMLEFSEDDAYGYRTYFGNISTSFSNTSEISYPSSFLQHEYSYYTLNAGDVNGDGIDDYAIEYSGNSNNENVFARLEVFYGGDLSKSTPDLLISHPDEYSLSAPTSGDFNGDGFSDIVVNYENEASGINIYFGGQNMDNIPDYEFTFSQIFSNELGKSWSDQAFDAPVNAGDINNDGVDDLIFSAYQVQEKTYVLYGGSSISTTPDLEIDYFATNFASIDDFNGDGINDIALSYFTDNIINIYSGFDAENGGSFSQEPLVTLFEPSNDGENILSLFGMLMDSGDFNGDGFSDIIATPFQHYSLANFDEGVRSHHIYLGGTNPDSLVDHKFGLKSSLFTGVDNTSQTGEFLTSNLGELTTVPDQNGDGADEILVGSTQGNFGFETNAMVYFGASDITQINEEGDILFEAPNQRLGIGANNNNILSQAAHSAVGDFDGDSKNDFLFTQGSDFNFVKDPVYIFSSDEFSINTEEVVAQIGNFRLNQNYPNPFNPSTNISYSIPQTADVSLKIYDVTGRLVSTLVNKRQASGTYDISLNASSWASGIYFYRIVAGDFVKTRKLTLIK